MIREIDVNRVPAILAFCVAVTNNFEWNRRWTFRAGAGYARLQTPRFLVVGVAAFACSFVVLQLLDVAHTPARGRARDRHPARDASELPWQRLWTFRLRARAGADEL